MDDTRVSRLDREGETLSLITFTTLATVRKSGRDLTSGVILLFGAPSMTETSSPSFGLHSLMFLQSSRVASPATGSCWLVISPEYVSSRYRDNLLLFHRSLRVLDGSRVAKRRRQLVQW